MIPPDLPRPQRAALPAGSARPITLALVGDVMLGRGVDAAGADMAPADMWGDVLPRLLAADARIANLECALTRHRRPWARSAKVFHFRARPEAARFLQAARFDVCALANNHVLDFEVRGLRDTLRTLDAAGIAHAGAGEDAVQASAPAIIDLPGVVPRRVAVVAFTDNQPDFAAGAGSPGTNYLVVRLDAATLDRVETAIRQAREAGAGCVVFSIHWGGNFVERPSALFRQFARRVIELGADVVHGHGAHIGQGIEIHQGRPILYDTGDFVDDYAVDPVLRNDRSCLYVLLFERQGLERIELFPVQLRCARVRLARGAEFDAIAGWTQSRCAEFGTPVERAADRLIVIPPPTADAPPAAADVRPGMSGLGW